MKNKVKEYREKRNWTQEQLAEESSVSRNTISALETKANTNVTYETMENISNALGEKTTIIFFEE